MFRAIAKVFVHVGEVGFAMPSPPLLRTDPVPEPVERLASALLRAGNTLLTSFQTHLQEVFTPVLLQKIFYQSISSHDILGWSVWH